MAERDDDDDEERAGNVATSGGDDRDDGVGKADNANSSDADATRDEGHSAAGDDAANRGLVFVCLFFLFCVFNPCSLAFALRSAGAQERRRGGQGAAGGV